MIVVSILAVLNKAELRRRLFCAAYPKMIKKSLFGAKLEAVKRVCPVLADRATKTRQLTLPGMLKMPAQRARVAETTLKDRKRRAAEVQSPVPAKRIKLR